MIAFDHRLVVIDGGRVRFDGGLDDLNATRSGVSSIEAVLGRFGVVHSDDSP
jgi:hypothetical protein